MEKEAKRFAREMEIRSQETKDQKREYHKIKESALEKYANSPLRKGDSFM